MKSIKILIAASCLALAACEDTSTGPDPEVVEIDDECPTADGTPCK